MNTPGAAVIRLILPFIILVPPFVTFLENLGEASGFYGERFGDAIDNIGAFIILSIILAIIARQMDREQAKRAESEKQLEESELIFQEFADKLDAVIYRASIDASRLFFVSPAFTKIWGRPTKDIYDNPRNFFEYIIPEDREQAKESFFNKIKSQPRINVNYRIQRPDGTIRDIHDQAFLVSDKHGQPAWIIGIAVDVTASVQAKKQKQAELEIINILENNNNIREVSTRVLKIICEVNAWDYAELWLVDVSANVLRCVNTWYSETIENTKFYRESSNYTFKFGEGLPGMAWKSGTSICIPDYAHSHKFHRSAAAEEAGFQSSIAVPVIFQGKTLGVMNFFSPESMTQGDEFITSLSVYGKLLGEFVHRKHSEEQLEYIAHFDLLTGILNRSTIEDNINEIINEKEPSIAIVILDIRHFRLINESNGHAKGDLILRDIALKLSKTCEENNVARLAADKFVIYYRKYKFNEEIEDVAKRLQRIFNEPFMIDHQTITLGVNIGISVYPKDGKDAATLIKNADIALSQSKAKGEANIQFFNEIMADTAMKKIELGEELKRALEQKELILYFQPQVSPNTESIFGGEALVRWQHPEKGLIQPGGFIPYAEENGLIIAINEYMLRALFKSMGPDWLGPPLSINVSPDQFVNKYRLLEYLEQLINEYDVNPQNVILEITESALMRNVQHNLTIMAALHHMGFKIALDDFGSGYSSFSYLQHFVADEIKIDKSFIKGLPEIRTNVVIVQSIISLFHSLGAKVVAEGVETREELDFLKANKCEAVQGFYYYKPIPQDEFFKLLNTRPGFHTS